MACDLLYIMEINNDSIRPKTLTMYNNSHCHKRKT